MLRERSENKQVFPPPPDSRNSAAASRGYSLSNEFATTPQDYLYIVVDPRVHKSTLRRNVPPGIISLRERRRRRRRREPRRHAAPRRADPAGGARFSTPSREQRRLSMRYSLLRTVKIATFTSIHPPMIFILDPVKSSVSINFIARKIETNRHENSKGGGTGEDD